MISSLPIGEKLSLKGKLFELSKKLQMIEMENQNTPEYTFAPEINNYFELPEYNFEANMKRADMIRLQKMEMLKSSIASANESVYTFSPQTSKRIVKISLENQTEYLSKPVGERLFEKAVESLKAKQELIEARKVFDEDGKKMFTPTIPKPNRIKNAASSSSSAGEVEPNCQSSGIAERSKGNSITAGEYMFRDAANREERLKFKIRAARAQANRGAQCHTKSKKSVALLRHKATKEVLAAFELMDEKRKKALSLQDIQNGLLKENVNEFFLQEYRRIQKSSNERNVVYVMAESAWRILDENNTGSVTREDFKSITVPIMLRETSTGSWSADNALPPPSVVSTLSDASSSFDHPPVCAVPKNKDLSALRLILRALIGYVKANPSVLGHIRTEKPDEKPIFFRGKYSKDENSFSPSINQKSRAMADKRRRLFMSESELRAKTFVATDSSLLVPYSRHGKQRLIDLKEAGERESCTFRPTLFKPLLKRTASRENELLENKESDAQQSQSSAGNSVVSTESTTVYEKLYKLKDKRMSKQMLEYMHEQIRKEAEELKELTFKPSLNVVVPPTSEAVKQPGFDEAVERMRAGRNKLLAESVRRKLEIVESDQRYKEGRDKLLKGFVIPSFLSEERIKKSRRKKAQDKPRLFVDVQLSSTKVVSIPIMDGDNPATIAKSFCMIYALDKPARTIVEEVVRQSMEVNLLQITEEEKNIETENPLMLSTKNNELRRSFAGGDELSVSSSSSTDDDYESSYTDEDDDDNNESDDDEIEEEEENENV